MGRRGVGSRMKLYDCVLLIAYNPLLSPLGADPDYRHLPRQAKTPRIAAAHACAICRTECVLSSRFCLRSVAASVPELRQSERRTLFGRNPKL